MNMGSVNLGPMNVESLNPIMLSLVTFIPAVGGL